MGAQADIEIENEENVKPLHRTTWKVPPRSYQERSKQLIGELLSSGVIMEESKPSKWWAEGKFVEKKSVSGKVKLRLVVDYRQLNNNIRRPMRAFPSMEEIRQ